MKLVELLARELSEWPKKTVQYVQGRDGCWPLAFDGARFEGSTWILKSGQTTGSKGDVLHIDMASDYKTAQVTRAQWQAERDRQKGGEWKRHRGGWMPTGLAGMVEVKLRCGDIQRADSHALLWRHEDCDVAVNIMKYRVISQPQAEEVEMIHSQESLKRVEINLMGITEGTFTQGPISLDNEVIYPAGPEWHTDQTDGPILWRDTINELDAYIEKFTRERDALIERLASEGFALLPPVVGVVSDFSGVDMQDWRNWMAGDIVASISNCHRQFSVGSEYEIESFADKRIEITSDDAGDRNGWGVANFKFIRRP